MSTQIDHAQAARAARTIRVAPAAAIGLALLVVGLATGLTFGWLQTGSAERAAPTPVTSPLAPDNTPRTSPPQHQPDPSSAPTAPVPIREVHQGDRLFGVYWVSGSLAQLSPVERQLRALGHPATSGDLDCDQGARRRLGVADSITSRVAVYLGTERDARAFAEGVEVRPRPYGVAAATLYCLD